MLTDYIRAAMKRAKYEIVEEDGSFYGSIPGFQGVWSNDISLEGCRDELQSALEDWIVFSLAWGGELPRFSRSVRTDEVAPLTNLAA